MDRARLEASFSRLANFRAAINAVPIGEHDRVVAASRSHLCVMICGSLEQNMKSIVKEHLRRIASPTIQEAVGRLCQNFQNPNPKRFIETTRLFNPDVATEFEGDWDGPLAIEREVLGSMVRKRKDIAHDSSTNVQVSDSDIQSYLQIHKAISERAFVRFLGG